MVVAKRSERKLSRRSASVSQIQSELASATSRNRASLASMVSVAWRAWRSTIDVKMEITAIAIASEG